MMYDIYSDIALLEDCHNNLEIGTKAKNIKIIKEQGGCLIPKTLILKTRIFNQLLIENQVTDPLAYNWSKFKISHKYREIIFERINREFNNKPLVIRSSTTCEDSPLLSFAGQYSSFVNISGGKKINILEAITLCYQSLFSDNAKVYAKMNGIGLEHESMAIIIQELIPVSIGGILFTVDPINHDDEVMIAEYTRGFGDSVVSGRKKPIRKEIKKSKIDNLKAVFLKKLVKNVLNLERVFGNPQDIEWGWDGKKIYIFQSRNITTLNKHPKIINYHFNKNKIISEGTIACEGITDGFLKIINDNSDYAKLKKGDIAFVKSNPSIVLFRKIPFINGLIINGGILSHTAVIAREFNVPCLVEPEITNGKIENYKNKKIILDTIKGKILLT